MREDDPDYNSFAARAMWVVFVCALAGFFYLAFSYVTRL